MANVFVCFGRITPSSFNQHIGASRVIPNIRGDVVYYG